MSARDVRPGSAAPLPRSGRRCYHPFISSADISDADTTKLLRTPAPDDPVSDVDATSIYGTLNLMILRALADGSLHGLGVQRRIEDHTDGRVSVEVGALYPALHRLEKEGLIEGSWGTSETRRRAKFYTLTASGRKRLERDTSRWLDHVRAVARLLGLREDAVS